MTIVNIREDIIRKWFGMWLASEDTGITDIFTEDAVYIESWGPEYHGAAAIRHWFQEWNTRGRVLRWDIRQFFHDRDQTVVEWYFENVMNDGTEESFDGMSLIRWAAGERMCYLQEFGCNRNRYDPYEKEETPKFRDEKAKWF